jgi:23S rRNA (adenine2503-C2)-methyltransferase
VTAADVTGLTVAKLEELLASRTRAVAAAKWIYGTRAWSSEIPTTLPGISAEAWGRLRAASAVPELEVVDRAIAQDGTTKFLVHVPGGTVETVLIPARDRSTVCVSSQIGCTRSCRFCATATLGFTRNLRAGEIVAQYLLARAHGAERPELAPATNVVFMGMGEPLDNLDEVLTAVEILTQTPAPQLGHAQVTVSTSGVVPGMRRFLAESHASLALSLNGSTDEQRTRVMPHNKTWPLAELLEVLRADRLVHPKRIHFIEYVMFDGVNDSDADAARVVELLTGINARLNLIPHNPIASPIALQSSSAERIEAFHRVVHAAGLRTMIRWPKGQDVAAACGQLARIRAK